MLSKLNIDKIATVKDETAEYLRKHAELQQRLDEMYWAFRELGNLIPQTLDKVFSGHFFPFSQAEDELQSSAALAHIGFYQHAIGGLRWVLELGMLSVYWDRADNAQTEIREWLKSKRDTPFKRQILQGLEQIPNVALYCERSTFRVDLEFAYKELSNYQHVKGVRYSSHHHSLGNIIRFNPAAFERWADLAIQVVRLVVTVHLLKYPVGLQDTPVDEKFGIDGPMGGFLNPWQADQLRALFSSEELATLQAISDADPEARALAEEFSRMPDVTQEELEQQFLRQDQFMIENQGFRSWLENERKIHDAARVSDEAERKFRARVRKLETWAAERGWLEHGRHGPLPEEMRRLKGDAGA